MLYALAAVVPVFLIILAGVALRSRDVLPESAGAEPKTIEVTVPDGATVLQATEAAGWDVQVEDSDYGKFVTSINGIANGSEGEASGLVYTVNDETVMEACDEPSTLKFLYPDDMPLRERVERIAREVYGADGVDWSPLALEKAQRFESDPRYADYCTMMVKTHLSLSHDPARKGVPTGWRLPVRDVLEYSGARFLCPVAGSISMMPGTGSDPAYRRIDVDTATGAVHGLF